MDEVRAFRRAISERLEKNAPSIETSRNAREPEKEAESASAA